MSGFSKYINSTINLNVNGTFTADGYSQLNNAQFIGRQPVSSDYYASGAEFLIAVTNTASNRTVFLPKASTVSGQVFVIKDESGGATAKPITIAPGDSSDRIDGATSVSISSNYSSESVYSNGTAYFTF
jgi:hypothetical protein